MLRKLRPHLSYANVAATLALVLAAGGSTAYAAAKIGKSDIGYHAVTSSKIAFNAITASKVRNSTLSGKDVRDSWITSADIRNGSLRADDLAAGQLPQGPKGEPGAPASELHAGVSAIGVLANGKGVTAVSPASRASTRSRSRGTSASARSSARSRRAAPMTAAP